MPARKARASGGLLIKLWWWLLIGLQFWVVGFFLDGFANSRGVLGCDHGGWAMSLVGLNWYLEVAMAWL